MIFYKTLRLLMLIFSAGFYTMHLNGAEIPGHPKSVEEIKREVEESDPYSRFERNILDIIYPDRSPHSEEDRRNYGHKE